MSGCVYLNRFAFLSTYTLGKATEKQRSGRFNASYPGRGLVGMFIKVKQERKWEYVIVE